MVRGWVTRSLLLGGLAVTGCLGGPEDAVGEGPEWTEVADGEEPGDGAEVENAAYAAAIGPLGGSCTDWMYWYSYTRTETGEVFEHCTVYRQICCGLWPNLEIRCDQETSESCTVIDPPT